MQTAHRLPSFEELYRQLRQLPEHLRGEILEGSLVVSPRPAIPHASAAAEIISDLRIHFRRKPGGPPTGWWILPEPELHLELPGQTHLVSPDLAGWRRERMNVPPDAAFISLPPDWVCEILSPSTARYDKKEKARIYHQAGVSWHWLVDPSARTVEAYRREGEFWIRLGVWSEEENAHIEPFEEVNLNLQLWWDGMPTRE